MVVAGHVIEWCLTTVTTIKSENQSIIPSQISSVDMPSYELDALADLIVNYRVQKGHVFMQQGKKTAPALYLVRSGRVSVKATTKKFGKELAGIFGLTSSQGASGEEMAVGSGGYFGADLLKEEQVDWAVPAYTITAEEDCIIGVLTMKTIWSVIGGRVEEGELNVDEYDKHKLLGAGTFGRVYLVSKQQATNKQPYALKIQKKRALINFDMVTGVLQERNIMVRLNHPFVIRLVNSSQDDPNIYMLTDLYQGGELRSVMDYCEMGVPEEAAAFYAGCILEGVSFMHTRRTLHRDLKPENVLLDSDGYAVLIDLGFAKVVHSDQTFTFCGTPIYLAPEVILQKGE
jgi:Protein kinase domain